MAESMQVHNGIAATQMDASMKLGRLMSHVARPDRSPEEAVANARPVGSIPDVAAPRAGREFDPNDPAQLQAFMQSFQPPDSAAGGTDTGHALDPERVKALLEL